MARARILCVLLLLARVDGIGRFGTAPRRPLQFSSDAFAACALGPADVDVVQFIAATRRFCALLRNFGRLMCPSINEVECCLIKAEDALAELQRERQSASRASRSRRRRMSPRSMKGLLTAEVEAGKHARHGVLADPSGAIGLLWVRRALAFWADVFEQQAEQLTRYLADVKKRAAGRRANARTIHEQQLAAYGRTVGPFHGWVSRRGFLLTARALPEWDELCRRANLAPPSRPASGGDPGGETGECPPYDAEALCADMRGWARAVRALTGTMTAIGEKLDLEDARKSI